MSRFSVILGWVVLVLAAAASFTVDWRDALQGGAVDLRNRITGIRVLEAGMDPYHYKWHPGDPVEFCDPSDNPLSPVNATTATPALLLLHVPLAMLPYRTAQLVWLACQWALLLGTGAIWFFSNTNARTRWLVAATIVGFSFTSAWRLHAERGQCYVLLLFAFACWLRATLDAKWSNGFWAGCFAGFLAALRPPFLLLVPFLALHRRGQWVGLATGMAVGFALPIVMLSTCWSDYFASAQTFSHLYRNDVHLPHGVTAFPPVIEGMPVELMNHFLYLPTGILSVHNFLLQHHLEPFPAAVPIFALGAAYLVWLWFSRRLPAKRLLPGLAGWVFLSDFCLPVFRESYDDVLIVNVIAAGLVISSRIPWAAWPCLVAVPLGAMVYFRNLDHPWVILPSALYALGSMLFILASSNVWSRRPMPGGGAPPNDIHP